jgi:hypothetical protein
LIRGVGTSGNKVIDNKIGNDGTGTKGLGNWRNGVEIAGGATDNWIGQTGHGNAITDSFRDGVYINGWSNSNHVVASSIGITGFGSGVLIGNWSNGVEIAGGSSENVIESNSIVSSGGDGSAQLDDLKGNGVLIRGGFTTENRVITNRIGNDGTGKDGMGNWRNGVEIADGASHNWIGQSVTDGNTITDNNCEGVYITGVSNINHVIGNGIGIDEFGIPMGNWYDGMKIDGKSCTNEIDHNTIVDSKLDGVLITGAGTDLNMVTASLIGIDDGGIPTPNWHNGVVIAAGASNNRIGTDGDWADDPLKGNVISGNKYNGVKITSEGETTVLTRQNTVAGNLIGTNLAGTGQARNEEDGVLIEGQACENIIGTNGDSIDDAVERNIISGNKFNGVEIRGAGTTGNVVAGNLIGTKANGTEALGNTQDGVLITSNASGNIIGTDSIGAGDAANERNIISGNTLNGVEIAFWATENTVAGNRIGTNASGTDKVSNVQDGVLINSHAFKNLIGTNGNGAGDYAERNVISGNTLNGVEFAVGATGNWVAGNLIGTKVGGAEALANGQDGVFIHGSSSGNIIGTDGNGKYDGEERNTISGNTSMGVEITEGAFGNRVAGNRIGTDPMGMNKVSNKSGVMIWGAATGNIIGTDGEGDAGGNAAEGNVISGNEQYGVQISGLGTSNNRVAGNYIGTKLGGTVALGNSWDGVIIYFKASLNIIGTNGDDKGDDAERNVISGNLGNGVLITGDGTTLNVVAGNKIGTQIDGTSNLGNQLNGVRIEGKASQNRIGADPHTQWVSIMKVEANTIAFNGKGYQNTLKGHGVVVESGTGNCIRGNSIFENYGRGIDLGDDSFTLNDGPSSSTATDADRDTGANNLQNFPVVTGVTFGAQKTITWTITGTPGAVLRVDFYSNDIFSLDPSGFGEGKTWLNTLSMPVTIGDDGTKTFTVQFDNASEYIAATATDADGNTSEFSMVDTDGDALADAWEMPTGSIDFNEDGKYDLKLSEVDPNHAPKPNHKDIYVEVDAIVGHAPLAVALSAVVDKFAEAPNDLVHNPDGEPGITLHAGPVDDGYIPVPSGQWTWNAFEETKPNWFGTYNERTGGNAAQTLAAKRLFCHYCIGAPTYYDSQGAWGGASDLLGNDFTVHFEDWEGAEMQAAGFMHELGHNLGLGHGGRDPLTGKSDPDNFKPNYHSIMNYTWAYRYNHDLAPGFSDSWSLDYSRQPLPDLNEKHLNEVDGIGGDPAKSVAIGKFTSYSKAPVPHIVPEWGAADYNNLNGLEADLSYDLNQDGDKTTLHGREDWSQLVYYGLEDRNRYWLDGACDDPCTDDFGVELWQAPPVSSMQSMPDSPSKSERVREGTVAISAVLRGDPGLLAGVWTGLVRGPAFASVQADGNADPFWGNQMLRGPLPETSFCLVHMSGSLVVTEDFGSGLLGSPSCLRVTSRSARCSTEQDGEFTELRILLPDLGLQLGDELKGAEVAP